MNAESNIFDLDALENDFDLKVKFKGKELQVKEPTLAQIMQVSKIESLPEDEMLDLLLNFVSSVLPNATQEDVATLNIRQMNALIQKVIEASSSDPTDAAPAS